MTTFPSTIAFGLALVLLLLLAQVHLYMGSTQWEAQIELDLMWLREKSDKLAYCRALWLQRPEIPLEDTKCGYYLRHDPKLKMGDMLLESSKKCSPGWDLLRGRCRKLV
ncbi:hypothetical protein KR054_006276 [Drosophila jambulina]|nr:hypothetical protein KR054_006276 [Drosophila jambulina]